MGEKSTVDTAVMDKLKGVGYTALELNYCYSIPAEGNDIIKPEKGKKYLSKNLKESRMELEFCIFTQANKKSEKIRRLIIIEDKKERKQMGSFETMKDSSGLYKFALTDVYHYAVELLLKTRNIKQILGIGVAGEDLDANAILFYKEGEVCDKYALQTINIGRGIKAILIPNFKEWDRLGKDNVEKFIKNDILRLNSPESKENIVHIKSVAADLSKSIDVSLKLDPYKRLLLVCGLLIGINQDPNIVYQFDDRKGAALLFETIKEALPESKFDHNKRTQLLRSFSFIRDEPELQMVVVDKKGKELGLPLKFISDKLQKKSAIGYSIIDLMKESTHIDLLGHLFDTFTKYVSVGGSQGDIVLTPSHLTRFMADIIDVNPSDNVLDITVGTGGFLIAALKRDEDIIMRDNSLSLTEKENKIDTIKKEKLWGIEYDANMFATCVANMMLHGDGKSHVYRGNSLIGRELTGDKRTFTDIFKDVKFNKLLFNPPYEHHLEYVKNGLSYIAKDGKAAIIIPKNTFNKCTETMDSIKEEIFNNSRLLAVIDLPKGQFKIKSKTVGTDVAIFLFSVGYKHNFKEESGDGNITGDIVTFIKLKKDAVNTKGAERGLPSVKTKKIFQNLTDYICTDFLDEDLLQDEEFFEPVLKKRIERYKFMYKDYAPLPCIEPDESEFLDVIGKYLKFNLEKEATENGV